MTFQRVRHKVHSSRWDFFTFTVFTLKIGQTGLSKQCRLRSDAAERGVWSGSTLFSTQPAVFFLSCVRACVRHNWQYNGLVQICVSVVFCVFVFLFFFCLVYIGIKYNFLPIKYSVRRQIAAPFSESKHRIIFCGTVYPVGSQLYWKGIVSKRYSIYTPTYSEIRHKMWNIAVRTDVLLNICLVFQIKSSKFCM